MPVASVGSVVALALGVDLMSRRQRSAVPFALAVQLGALPASAQVIRGRVIDHTTFLGVAAAGITAVDSAGKAAATTLTDSTGTFLLRLPAPGQFRLRTNALGYRPDDTRIALLAGAETTLELRLLPDALAIDSLTVMAQRRVPRLAREGFYRRKAEGFGHFLEEKEIEAKVPIRFSDLLRGMSGVGVVCGGFPPLCDARMRGAARPCPPTVVLDGRVLRVGGAAGFAMSRYETPDTALRKKIARGTVPAPPTTAAPLYLDELLNPLILAAVEVYPGAAGVPVQYTGSMGACGAVIAWSKR